MRFASVLAKPEISVPRLMPGRSTISRISVAP